MARLSRGFRPPSRNQHTSVKIKLTHYRKERSLVDLAPLCVVPKVFVTPSNSSMAEGRPKGPLSIVRGSVLGVRFLSLAATGSRSIENVKRR